MFRAVREWWRSGKGQDTARLFVFELVVVMIGVFAAQQVSSWADKRAAINQVEGVHDNLFHSFGTYRAIARANRVAIPCIDDRVDLILGIAASGRAAEPELLAPARLLGMAPDEISPQDTQLLRERYGDRVADTIGSVEFNLRTMERSGAELDRLWLKFQRLNQAHGQVSDADRSSARETGVEIKGSLYALRKSNDFLLTQLGKLDLPRRPDIPIRPVADCDQMWRSGKGYRENAD